MGVINSCRPEVYDTKLTAPETISRSRNMVGAHQNLNGSRDLTTPLLRMVRHAWASTCYQLPTKFKISYSTHYDDMKGDTKCRNWSILE